LGAAQTSFKRMKILCVVLLLTAALAAQGRRGRGVSAGPATPLSAYPGLTATFHGTVKSLTKKEIVLQTGEEQMVSIRLNGKTKFFKEDKEVKVSKLETETVVTVDVSEDNDLKPMALKVTVDPGQKEKAKPELVKR